MIESCIDCSYFMAFAVQALASCVYLLIGVIMKAHIVELYDSIKLHTHIYIYICVCVCGVWAHMWCCNACAVLVAPRQFVSKCLINKLKGNLVKSYQWRGMPRERIGLSTYTSVLSVTVSRYRYSRTQGKTYGTSSGEWEGGKQRKRQCMLAFVIWRPGPNGPRCRIATCRPTWLRLCWSTSWAKVHGHKPVSMRSIA